MNTKNLLSIAIGLGVVFGTAYLISKAWKAGQK